MSIKFGKYGFCLKTNALMWRWGPLGRSSVPIATRREYVCSITFFEMLVKGYVTSECENILFVIVQVIAVQIYLPKPIYFFS